MKTSNKKILEKSKKLLPFIVLIILSLIPAIFTSGRLNVGGDVMIFLDETVLAKKYLFQWIVNESNGKYLSTSYYALFGFYKFLSMFNLDIYQIASVLIFSLNFIAGLAIWKLAKVFVHDEKGYVYFIPITFYIFSPALFNGWHYSIIYAFIPWFIYLTFKVIKNKSIGKLDVFYFALIILFSSTELPNPKYIFHLAVVFIVSIIISLVVKLLTWKDIKPMIAKLSLIMLLCAYLIVPLGYFAMNYSPDQYGVHIRENYSDEGKMMNAGVDTIDRVLKLHQDFIFINRVPAKAYNTNIFLKMIGYVFIFIIIFSLSKFEKLPPLQKKLRLVLLSALLIYIFFSAGPNPPFGYIYEELVSRFNLLAFLRTTGGGVFFLSVFYSMFLFLFVSDLKKNKLLFTIIILLTIIGVGHPFVTGEYYKNYNNVSKFTDRTQYGFKIPEEYTRVKELLEDKRLDAKIFYPNSKLVYIHTSWGFFGPIIYNFYFPNQNISYDKIYSTLENHNIGYVLIDNSIIEKANFDTVADKITILKDNFIDLANYSREKYLPHIYSASKIIVSELDLEELSSMTNEENNQLRDIVLLKNQNIGKNITDSPDPYQLPDIEYKKINITKYKVVIHGARGEFPLVFSESFHPGWKVYIMPQNNDSHADNRDLNERLSKYVTLPNNEEDQATKETLMSFISEGQISDLGSNDELDFVSKKYQGTIQNDNLDNGSIADTWGKESISDSDHIMVNGYANAWMVDPDEICGKEGRCIENEDSHDIKLIIEFLPQRIFYLSLSVSLLVALSILGWIVYCFINSQRKVKIE